jgi:chromosome partitioning protein
MILSVAHIKGGVGKSLLTVNIAAVLAQRGRDVLVIDADEQASTATFAQIRAEADPQPAAFATIRLYGAAIRQEMRKLREKYDELIIDTGGRDTGSLSRRPHRRRRRPDPLSAAQRRSMGWRPDRRPGR